MAQDAPEPTSANIRKGGVGKRGAKIWVRMLDTERAVIRKVPLKFYISLVSYPLTGNKR
jgi:hypothetical protein